MEPAELRKSAERWMSEDPDPDTREELRKLLAQPDLASTDLADRFAAPLEFGTAGLRGVLAAGPNRMNLAVVVRATWGLAQELLATVPGAAMRGVVVGGDARRMSRQLSEHVAVILAAAGIKVVLFRAPVPTPLVGFAVKSLGAAAGVVVTASHNPPEYNGYKVYWENAAQIVPPIDARIASAITRAPPATEVVQKALRDPDARSLVTDAPPSLERAYLDAIRALAVHPHAGDRALRIVYTPLHGVGDALVRRALSESGFTDVTSVPEQQKPDGAFPTVAFPNPEEKGAMDLSFALAKKTGAHLVLANDPDADRLAMAVPEGDGFRQLTGNQVGVLLGHYLLTERPAESLGKKPRAVLASIVSSPLLGRIAGSLGVRYEETLTGFKWIANRAMELERDPEQPCEFVFGYEEALGYCVGDVVRDKDGISGALLAAEVVAVLRQRGRTVQDELEAIARRWGVFASTQVNVTRKGVSGVASLRAMMARLRGSPPRRVGDDEVVAVSDYEARTRTDSRTRGVAPLSLPKSNVLALDLASGSRIIARPSGTEPKAKFYFDVREDVRDGEPVAVAEERAALAMRRLADSFVALADA
ncbi:MAG TPA: phospho-sugar mutase [Polyangiaceae bacterium]|jgi:phosphomannomutase